MRAQLGLIGAFLLSVASAFAQLMPDREELRKIPLDEALVLDPTIGWDTGMSGSGGDSTPQAAVEILPEGMRAIVAGEGKQRNWDRWLRIPVDSRRYPIAVLTYRAWGLASSNSPLVAILTKRAQFLLTNREAIADGEVHELVVDLSELGTEGEIRCIQIRPYCGGDGPAVFDLLGLRFESDGRLPPADYGPAPEFEFEVVGVDGKPLPGATVTVDAGMLNVARSGATDADGKVTVQGLAVPASQHILRVTKEGMAPFEHLPRGDDTLPKRITLFPGTRYGGVVVDEGGKPIPLVSITLSGFLNVGGVMRSWNTQGLTDADGKWLSPVLPETESIYNSRLIHPDYQSGQMAPDSIAALRQGKARMVMLSGYTLVGQVQTPDGEPLPDADVRCAGGAMGVLEAKSDADGRFSFSALSRNRRAWIVVQHPRFGPAQLGVDPAKDTTQVTLRMQEPRRLRGQVVAPDGKPVPGARLRLQRWGAAGGFLPWHTEADRDGRFVWANAPAEEITLYVERGKYMGIQQYPVQASEDEVRIVLPPPLRISGTVTDTGTGKAIRDCRVSYGMVPEGWRLGIAEAPQWSHGNCQTDLRGRFEVSVRSAEYGQQVVLKFEKEGYPVLFSRCFTLVEGEQEHNVELVRGADIEGVVLLPDGTPVADTPVYLVTPGRSLNLNWGKDDDPRRAQSTRTDGEGRFRLPAAAQDEWLIAVPGADGYAQVGSDSYTAPASLTMRSWAAVEGMVLKDGKPWSECLIEIRPHPPHVDRTRPQVDFILSDHTNETGAFSVARIRPGLVGVYCAPPGSMYGPGPSSHCTILSLAPEQNVRLEYGRGQRNVVGRLALAEGVEDTVVSWSTAGGSVTPKLDISVPEPERPESSVQMSRKEQLAWLATPEGKAYTDAYRKHRQATVEAAARSGLPFCRFQVAEDGTFEVPYLPPGSYTLRASARLGRQDAGWQAKPQYAHVIHEFTVADVPVREVGAPLDLGTLLLDKEK